MQQKLIIYYGEKLVIWQCILQACVGDFSFYGNLEKQQKSATRVKGIGVGILSASNIEFFDLAIYFSNFMLK